MKQSTSLFLKSTFLKCLGLLEITVYPVKPDHAVL